MSPMEIEQQRAQKKSKLQVRAHLSVPDMGNTPARLLLNEDVFGCMLYMERRRAARADKRFVLILFDVKKTLAVVHKDRTILALTNALSEATRETDIIGWYLENNLLGVIGTELGKASNQVVQERFLSKLRNIFESALGLERSSSISVSFHFFPEECPHGDNYPSANISLSPDFQNKESTKKVPLAIKRFIDVVGSGAALIVLSPVYLAIGLAIKAFSSKVQGWFKHEPLG